MIHDRMPLLRPRLQAFSLVELSIVIAILGLLAGGLIASKSLIRAAELRSVGNDITRYMAAIAVFHDKYKALPGDMSDATSVWGKDNANCPGHSGTASAFGTCNGNGDDILQDGSGVGSTAEIFQLWRQMKLAGLIGGEFTGISHPTGTATGRTAFPGYNVPVSRITDAGFSMEYRGPVSPGDWLLYEGFYNNVIIFGKKTIAPYCCPAEMPALKPEEAKSIDTKIDDGRPALGFVRNYSRLSYAGFSSLCNTTDVAATNEYNVSSKDFICTPVIITGY